MRCVQRKLLAGTTHGTQHLDDWGRLKGDVYVVSMVWHGLMCSVWMVARLLEAACAMNSCQLQQPTISLLLSVKPHHRF